MSFVFMAPASAEVREAETANDLFEIYSHETVAGLHELQDEYLKTKEEYEFLYKDVQAAEAYNRLYESAEAYQEEKKIEIDKSIRALMVENRAVIAELEGNIEGEIISLRKLDAKYKVNLDMINSLLNKRSKYSLTARKKVDYNLLDDMEKEVSYLEGEYKASIDVTALGEVTDVKLPLGRDSFITSLYGDRIDPLSKSNIQFHSGIDIKANMNTEVLALFHGVVKGTGYWPIGGYFVTIDHGNGILSYYCHLNEIRCVAGQKVNQYDTIALSGNSGLRATTPHLHLGLYINGNPVDPGVLYLSQAKRKT